MSLSLLKRQCGAVSVQEERKRQDQRLNFTVLSSILIWTLERKLRLFFVVLTTTRHTPGIPLRPISPLPMPRAFFPSFQLPSLLMPQKLNDSFSKRLNVCQEH